MSSICHIVAAGDFDPAGFVLPSPGDLLIAADAGFAHLQALGITPDVVVGDFDSLGVLPEHPSVVQTPVVKDDTDTLTAVRLGLERGYRHFRLYGTLGGARLDHTLANIQTLGFLLDHGAHGWLIGRGEILTAIRNESYTFSAEYHGTLSVFAIGGEAVGVSEQGLQYTLHNATLSPFMPLGVSNAFLGQPATVSVKTGTLLLCYASKTAN